MASTTVRIQVGGHRGDTLAKYMLVDPVDADIMEWQWSQHSAGYAGRQDGPDGAKVQIYAHRVILERKIGRAIERHERADHINHDRLDNRRENLRVVTHAQNLQHRGGMASTNTSGYRGVTWDSTRRKWRAQVACNGKTFNCGRYDTPEAAALAAEIRRTELGFLTA